MDKAQVRRDQIAFEAFRVSRDGVFGITVTTHDTTFDTGPFATFEAVQEALHTLVDDAIKGGVAGGNRIGVKRILLGVVPDHD